MWSPPTLKFSNVSPVSSPDVASDLDIGDTGKKAVPPVGLNWIDSPNIYRAPGEDQSRLIYRDKFSSANTSDPCMLLLVA